MQLLIDELKNPGYVGKTDQQAADAINAKVITVRRLVDLWEVEEHARRNGYRAELELAKQDANNPCQKIAIDILAYVTSPRSKKIDMDIADTRQMLVAMVQCGFASQSHADELIALADSQVRWLDHIGVGSVSASTIKDLREEISGLKARKDLLMRAGAERWNAHVNAIDALKITDPDPVL